MPRRRTRKYKGPKRPLRWIYSGQWENDNEETECAVLPVFIACGLPVGVVDPPRSDGGEFWHELVRGETDLDFSDKAAPCITRIVGDASFRAGWNFLVNPPGYVGTVNLEPVLRVGVCVVDEPSGTGWLPPDLWDEDDGLGQRWLYRAQRSFPDPHHSINRLFELSAVATPGVPAGGVRIQAQDWNVHLDIRVNATLNHQQSLIMCHSYRFYFPGFIPGAEPIEDATAHRMNVLHDLRCLVKS